MSQIKNAQIRYRIIDRCIRNQYKPFPSKQELRKACEQDLYGSTDNENICDSTIEKDLFAMRMDHDAPINYSKIENGYYYEDEEYSIDNIPLTVEDVQAIQFATKTLMQFKGVEMFNQFGNAIDKIVDRVSIATNMENGNTDSIIQFEKQEGASGNEHLSILVQCIQNFELVHFDYTSFVSGKSKLREVLPLLLKEYRNRWYLICADLEKEKTVTYALERMKNVGSTGQTAEVPSGFNPKHFFDHTIGITTHDGDPEEIIFKAGNVAAKYIDSQPFHTSQKMLKQGEKRTTFELKVIVTEELIREILSYAGDIEVMEPLHLREIIGGRLKVALENYNMI
jgi:predicted DNA-binding transcriptional regulator YafY